MLVKLFKCGAFLNLTYFFDFLLNSQLSKYFFFFLFYGSAATQNDATQDNNYYLNDIKEKLDQKIYKLDAKRPAGKSPAWQYFLHILDENAVRIPNYFCCVKCMTVKQLGSNEPSYFLDHHCIKNANVVELACTDSDNSDNEMPPNTKRQRRNDVDGEHEDLVTGKWYFLFHFTAFSVILKSW
jgi:hypothetical protein